jgi:hypothetical protein
VHRVFFFPGTGFHLLEAGADDDLDVLAAKAARRAAAVHGGVAAAEDDHPLADRSGVAESDAGQPVDAQVNRLCCLFPSGDVEVVPARRAGTNENRVVAFAEQILQRTDVLAAAQLDAEVEDVTGLLVDDFLGQPKLRDLGAHHAAGEGVAVVDHHFVAERCQVARHGQ